MAVSIVPKSLQGRTINELVELTTICESRTIEIPIPLQSGTSALRQYPIPIDTNLQDQWVVSITCPIPSIGFFGGIYKPTPDPGDQPVVTPNGAFAYFSPHIYLSVRDGQYVRYDRTPLSQLLIAPGYNSMGLLRNLVPFKLDTRQSYIEIRSFGRLIGGDPDLTVAPNPTLFAPPGNDPLLYQGVSGRSIMLQIMTLPEGIKERISEFKKR